MSNELTRRDIELRLEKGLVGKNIQFLTIHSQQVIGMVQRLSVNIDIGEVMVVFTLGSKAKLTRYECDIRYFNENTEILYGDTYTGDKRNIRRLLEND
jgi:acid phosphatase class B